MLIYQCICLAITFYVLQYYISAGVHVRTHRLLPMLLTTIALYNFYEIVKYLTQAWEIITFLEILLVVQMIYVVLFYVLDFLKIKPPTWITVIFFIILFCVDVIIFKTYPDELYLRLYFGFITFFAILIVALATYAFLRYSISRKEYHVTVPSYITLLVPAIGLALSKLGVVNQDIIMPAALEISSLIFLYMMRKNLLTDTETILFENLYTTSHNAYFMFDQYLYYINSNEAARKLFPEQIAKLESKKRSERYVPIIQEILDRKDEIIEYEQDNVHYVCRLRGVIHKNKINGYILSLIDITHQKNELFLMEELKKAAEETNRKKTQIMIQTSHDLRSPLHTIIGSSDILIQRKILDNDNLSLVRQIKNAGKNLLSLVNDMLDFTKMEAGDITLESSSGFLAPNLKIRDEMNEGEEVVPKWFYPEAKALIADDMKLNLYIFKELISPWKLKIDTVTDGKAAIEAAKKENYDIIFLDRLMPEKDGLETCIELKQMTKAPIILLSANMSEYDVAEYEPYGFNDYMAKPFSKQRLKSVIENNIAKALRVKNDEVSNEAVSDNVPASAPGNEIKAGISTVVLSSYVSELEDVKLRFYEWLKDDISLFRTKVHGIKGLSRQVGYTELGEASEVFEMAAKANHVDYISRHAEEYLEQIDGVIEAASVNLEEKEVSSDNVQEENLDDLFDNF